MHGNECLSSGLVAGTSMRRYDDLLKRLDAAGATGADLSPGDPLAKDAAAAIRDLREQLRDATSDTATRDKTKNDPL